MIECLETIQDMMNLLDERAYKIVKLEFPGCEIVCYSLQKDVKNNLLNFQIQFVLNGSYRDISLSLTKILSHKL